MSGDPIDLDAIKEGDPPLALLVAELRSLRAGLERAHHVVGAQSMRSASSDPLDLDAIEAEFLQQCGPCDGGLPMGCTCSPRDFRGTMSALVAEVRRLRAWLEAEADWLNAAHDGSLVTSDYPMIARRMIAAMDGP